MYYTFRNKNRAKVKMKIQISNLNTYFCRKIVDTERKKIIDFFPKFYMEQEEKASNSQTNGLSLQHVCLSRSS